jgi:hypothetical protein
MRTLPIGVLGFLAATLALPNLGNAQSPSRSTPAGPFVDITVDGSGVVLRPERVRYRVSADPGTYVTIFLISPTGRVSLLNPYERAVKGSGRREIIREARTGFAPGESYLVAAATKSAAHNAELIRIGRNETRLAAGYYSAETSMDELVMNTVRRAGDDFSVAYASFRVLADDYPGFFAYTQNYNQSCSYPPLSPNYTGLYETLDRGSFPIGRLSLSRQYDEYADQSSFLSYSELLNLESSCNGQIFQTPFLVARAPVLSNPMPPRDTSASRGDSVPKLFPPVTPRVPIPFDPDPRNSSPGVPAATRTRPSLRIDPLSLPTVPVEGGTPAAHTVDPPRVPVTAPVPVETQPRVPFARMQSPRIDPVPTPMPVMQSAPMPAPSPPRPYSPPPTPSTLPKPQPVPVTPPPGE